MLDLSAFGDDSCLSSGMESEGGGGTGAHREQHPTRATTPEDPTPNHRERRPTPESPPTDVSDTEADLTPYEDSDSASRGVRAGRAGRELGVGRAFLRRPPPADHAEEANTPTGDHCDGLDPIPLCGSITALATTNGPSRGNAAPGANFRRLMRVRKTPSSP